MIVYGLDVQRSKLLIRQLRIEIDMKGYWPATSGWNLRWHASHGGYNTSPAA